MISQSIPSPLAAALIAAWRLGLGWMVGRPFLLVTTVMPDGAVRRSVVRYAFAGGNFYVPGDGGDWQDDLTERPACTVQAYPGPKGVTGRRIEDEAARAEARTVLRTERPRLAAALDPGGPLFLFAPTGDRVPEMLLPDLVWLWAPALLALAAVRPWRRVSGRPR